MDTLAVLPECRRGSGQPREQPLMSGMPDSGLQDV